MWQADPGLIFKITARRPRTAVCRSLGVFHIEYQYPVRSLLFFYHRDIWWPGLGLVGDKTYGRRHVVLRYTLFHLVRSFPETHRVVYSPGVGIINSHSYIQILRLMLVDSIQTTHASTPVCMIGFWVLGFGFLVLGAVCMWYGEDI